MEMNKSIKIIFEGRNLTNLKELEASIFFSFSITHKLWEFIRFLFPTIDLMMR